MINRRMEIKSLEICIKKDEKEDIKWEGKLVRKLVCLNCKS